MSKNFLLNYMIIYSFFNNYFREFLSLMEEETLFNKYE